MSEIRARGDEQTMNTGSELRATLRGMASFPATMPGFVTDEAPEDPTALFTSWLGHAVGSGVAAPHAMTLSTVDNTGTPDARVLILKDLDESGWWFAASAASPKGRQLALHPAAALTFSWLELGRQVRVRGPVITASAQRSRRDFADRGPAARAVALGSSQSERLASAQAGNVAIDAVAGDLARDPGLFCPAWTLYAVVPESIEFWQASHDRRHVRLRYELCDGRWTRGLLWP